MKEGVAGGNFWEERVGQALSITITAASASLLSALSASHCYIFVFVLLAVKQKQVQSRVEVLGFTFGSGEIDIGRGLLGKKIFLTILWTSQIQKSSSNKKPVKKQ